MINGIQVRGARGLLDWSQKDLADRAGIALRTLRLLEAGNRQPYRKTIGQIQEVLEAAGVRFISTDAGVGVFLTQSSEEAL